MNNPEKIIKQLKERIKDLQNQLCERTRNYLLQKGFKSLIIVQKEDKSVQADFENLEFSNYTEYLQDKSPATESYSTSMQKQLQKQLQTKVQVSDFSHTYSQEQNQLRKKISDLLEQLKDYLGKIDESFLKLAECEANKLQMPHPDTFDRQKWKLKRQISKLVTKISFQQKINQIAKEGLLISEEQNYRFRLKITELLKSQQNNQQKNQGVFMVSNAEIECLREQIMTLQHNLDHERLIKQEYLQTSLELQDQISKLTEENDKLKSLIIHISSYNQKQNEADTSGKTKVIDFSEKSQSVDPKIFQQIKNSAFQISNCIPITDETDSDLFFRPETQFEILKVLKRVQQYCKEIGKWEVEKINEINRQKMLFVQFIRTVSQQIDENTKEILKKELVKTQNLNHFVNLLEKSQSSQTHSCSAEKQNHQNSIQKDLTIRM